MRLLAAISAVFLKSQVFVMRRIVVRRSLVHGRGVFALTNIPSGELLLEYKGEVTSWRVASQRYQRNRAEDGHTFFFGLDGASSMVRVVAILHAG
jgi:SET domain-containing protein